MSFTRLAGFTHETGICNHLVPEEGCQRRNAVKPLASTLLAAGRTFGPYLAIELVMPGPRSHRREPRTDEFQPPSRFYTCGRHL